MGEASQLSPLSFSLYPKVCPWSRCQMLNSYNKMSWKLGFILSEDLSFLSSLSPLSLKTFLQVFHYLIVYFVYLLSSFIFFSCALISAWSFFKVPFWLNCQTKEKARRKWTLSLHSEIPLRKGWNHFLNNCSEILYGTTFKN